MMAFPTAGFLILAVGICAGCTTQDTADATNLTAGATASSPHQAAASGPGSDAGLQFRAVCLETAAHGGNQYILTKWLDSRDKAKGYGEYHGDFKEKGHRWRLEQRVKPQ
jgi:hypothetical protein